MTKALDRSELAAMAKAGLAHATGLRQQVAVKNGARGHLLCGQNEGGAQRFHQWVEKSTHTDDDKLEVLFAAG